MLLEWYNGFRDFLELGGWVLMGLLFVSVWMWALIFERFLYLWFFFPSFSRKLVNAWSERGDKKSWHAHKIRSFYVSLVGQNLRLNLNMIKVLVALCPFIGIMGTVTGMIQVFETMATLGTGNARAMAAGISKATVPTMAGLVIALSGLIFSSILEGRAARLTEKVEDTLVYH